MKKRSGDKYHERHEQIMLKLYFKVVEDQNKGRSKKKIREMKNEENDVQTDRNEILKICPCFYTELYSSTLQDQHFSHKRIPAQTD